MKVKSTDIANNIDKLKHKMNFAKKMYTIFKESEGEDAFETNQALIRYERAKVEYAKASNIVYYSKLM